MLGRWTKRRTLIVGVVVVAAVVAYYLASPLWINVQVSEPLVEMEAAKSTRLTKGSFTDADDFHKTKGTTVILRFVNSSRILRFEDFQTTNGPDLFVYLSAEKEARTFLNVGGLKGNIGDQNYQIPADADLSRYKYVLIWCRAFSVLFGSAELTS